MKREHFENFEQKFKTQIFCENANFFWDSQTVSEKRNKIKNENSFLNYEQFLKRRKHFLKKGAFF